MGSLSLQKKIRILHLTTDSKIAGAEKLLIGIAREFNRTKYDLFFCTLKEKGNLHAELEKLGQKTFSLHCYNIYGIAAAVRRLRELTAAYKIDILHTHLYHASVLGQFAARFSNSITPIMTRHYSDLLYLYGNCIDRFLDRRASNWAKQIIAISEGVKNVLVNFDRISPDKITVIHNGVDIASFRPDKATIGMLKNSFSIADNTKIIGAIGSLHPRKGHRYLIEAANIICQERDDIKFMVVGEGHLENELKSLRDNLGLKDKVIFTGYRRDIENIISMMDIVVQPSVEEGFGITIIEAMGLGKPVVATAVGGIPEIIEDKRTGILVAPKDSYCLAAKICNLIDNPVLARRMGENAEKVVGEKFSLISMVRQYEHLYEELLRK